MTEQVIMGTKQNTGGSEHQETFLFFFLLGGWLSTSTSGVDMLCNLPPWGYSKTIWTQLWTSLYNYPCFIRGLTRCPPEALSNLSHSAILSTLTENKRKSGSIWSNFVFSQNLNHNFLLKYFIFDNLCCIKHIPILQFLIFFHPNLWLWKSCIEHYTHNIEILT